ncbi:MAG: metallophosphoesterase [Paracoccaceae bacterium]
MGRIYAIGDIHGHLDRLRSVHHWIDADHHLHGGDYVVVHVGDLTDRGPDSAGVIQFLIDGLSRGQPWVVLRGNHDRMMSLYLQDPSAQDGRLRADYSWLHHRLGGLTTLASYGVLPAEETNPKIPKGKHWLHQKSGGRETLTSYGIDLNSVPDRELAQAARAAVPPQHQAFLAGLDTMYRSPDAVFVHAGIKPGVAIEDQVEDDLIWIREPFLNDRRDHGPLIIHGHTPIDAPTHYGNRVNIDSGVAFGGPLSVIVVERRDVWNLTAAGRVPMQPVNPL